MSTYVIRKSSKVVPLGGEIAGTPWAAAEVLTIDQYPWYYRKFRRGTAARLLYDKRAVYIQFQCDDREIFSRATDLNGHVYKDSCVEFFATIDPASGPDYFNLEVNCCGVVHMGFGPARENRKLITPELASRVTVVTSIKTPTKQLSPDDNGWWMAAALPFDLIADFTGKKFRHDSGSVWRANFYRCGGRRHQPHSAWNPIDTPEPDFHRPEFFGEIRFE